jgi:hypothetical protein
VNEIKSGRTQDKKKRNQWRKWPKEEQIIEEPTGPNIGACACFLFPNKVDRE